MPTTSPARHGDDHGRQPGLVRRRQRRRPAARHLDQSVQFARRGERRRPARTTPATSSSCTGRHLLHRHHAAKTARRCGAKARRSSSTASICWRPAAIRRSTPAAAVGVTLATHNTLVAGAGRTAACRSPGSSMAARSSATTPSRPSTRSGRSSRRPSVRVRTGGAESPLARDDGSASRNVRILGGAHADLYE